MKSEKKRNDYIVFPLSCLALDVSFTFLINCIIDYGIIYQLNKIYNIRVIKKYMFGFNIKEWKNEELEEFQKYYEETIYSIRRNFTVDKKLIFLRYKIIINQNRIFEEKVKRITKISKKDATVLLNTGLLIDILIKNALKERQFRIICAIYSAIGTQPYIKISNKEINFRLNGFRSEDVYKICKMNNLKRLSDKILRNEINFLGHSEYTRNFFDRARYGNRIYIYSRVIRGDKLENIVLKLMLKSKIRKKAESLRNAKILEKYNNILKKMKSSDFNLKELENIVETTEHKETPKIFDNEDDERKKAKSKLDKLKKEFSIKSFDE